MAKTHAEFRKTFDDIKKLAGPNVAKMTTTVNNLGKHREYMTEHFPALGVRIQALRKAGRGGDSIDSFMVDKEAHAMFKELLDRRETARKTAKEAELISSSVFGPMVTKIAALEKAVTAEIAERKKKVSSKVLGMNQSVKEMEPLLAEIKLFKQGPDYKYAENERGSGKRVERVGTLFDDLLAEQMTQTSAESLKGERLMLQMQKLNDKVMKQANSKAAAAYVAMGKQDQAARTAHRAKDVPALAAAKTAAGIAMAQIDAVVKPYQAIMKDPDVINGLSQALDKPAVDKAFKSLVDTRTRAESLLGDIEALRMV
ncbi:MAG: hypothetical protein ABIQ99_09605 [Thermoflexales bacterium]